MVVMLKGILAGALMVISRVATAQIPEGFSDTVLAVYDGRFATAMGTLPTGHLVLGMRTGEIHVFRPGDNPTPQPFFLLNTAQTHEGGIIGMAVDPAYATTRRIYFYFVEDAPDRDYLNICFIRTSENDVTMAEPGSYTPVFRVPDDHVSEIHYGGGMAFDDEGHLYVGLGDDGIGSNPQDPTSIRGKVLRLNPDGSTPADNPDFGLGSPVPFIATGLRNPFRFVADPMRELIYIHDVGSNRFEESNILEIAANYGWELIEGPLKANPGQTPPENYRDPWLSFIHADQDSSPAAFRSLTDGIVYNGPGFPPEYHGKMLVCDWQGFFGGKFVWIDRDESGAAVGTSIWYQTPTAPTDLVELGGDLYYTAFGFQGAEGVPVTELRRIRYTGNSAPKLTVQTSETEGVVPFAVTFSATVEDEDVESVEVLWNFGDGRTFMGLEPGAVLFERGAIYPITVTATDKFGTAAVHQFEVLALQEAGFRLDATILDVSGDEVIPATGDARLVDAESGTPIELPRAGLSFVNGVLLAEGDNFRFPGDELAVELSIGGTAPRIVYMGRDGDGNYVLNGEYMVSRQAVSGTLRSTDDELLIGAPVEFGISFFGREIPMTFPEETAPARTVTDRFGRFWIPVLNRRSGIPLRVTVFPDGHASLATVTRRFTGPRDGTAAWETRIGRATDVESCPPPGGSFAVPQFAVVEAILASNCMGCHGHRVPYRGIDLSDGFWFSQLINRESREAPGIPLITFGDPSRSYLLEKINCSDPQVGSQMPPSTPLSDADRALLTDWVRNSNGIPGTAWFSQVYASTLAGTSPLVVEFRAGTVGGVPPYTTTWEIGGKLIRSGESIMHSFVETSTAFREIPVIATVRDSANPPNEYQNTVTILLNGARAAELSPEPQTPTVNLIPRVHHPVRFDAGSSTSPNGPLVSYAWDFNADGVVDVEDSIAVMEWTFDRVGEHEVILTVTDARNGTASVLFTLQVHALEGVDAPMGFVTR